MVSDYKVANNALDPLSLNKSLRHFTNCVLDQQVSGDNKRRVGNVVCQKLDPESHAMLTPKPLDSIL